MSKSKKDKHMLNFIIDVKLLKKIDNFRFKYHFSSRAAAIKWLLAWALEQKPVPEFEEDDY